MKATFYDVKKREKVEVEVVAKVKYPNGRCALRAKTTDGRNLILSRYTQPEKELQLLLHQLSLTLPEQPPPRLEELKNKCSEDL